MARGRGGLATADWKLVSLQPVHSLSPQATQLTHNPSSQKDKAVRYLDKEVSDQGKEGDQDVEQEQGGGESRGEGDLLLPSIEAACS